LNKNGYLPRLFQKKWNGKLNRKEKKLLNQWLARSPKNRKYYERLTKEYSLKHLEQFEEKGPGSNENLFAIKNEIQEEASLPSKKRKSFSKAACFAFVAASVAACIILLLNIYQPSVREPLVFGNMVVLELADGTAISPDTVKGNLLIDQSDCQLIVNNHEVRYVSLHGKYSGKKKNAFNEIRVPACKQFTVVFPDRSKVSLNAVSSIRFPVSDGDNIRSLEFTGEGFFEIQSLYAGKNKIPFVVKVITPGGLDQEVIVTGTTFNINAYCDESVIKTTLFDGKVKVASKGEVIWLSPGEELHVGESRKSKMKSNEIENAIAWKDGDFLFNDVPIQHVLNEISRWYDMEVVFEGDPTDLISFVGPRSEKFKFIIDGICIGYKYKYIIQGNRVLLLKNR
jgi:transmembrane sensor